MGNEPDKKDTYTIQQRMSIFLHEYSAHSRFEMSKYAKPVDTKEQVEAKQKEYFANFPFDEQAVRDFLSCYGYFGKHDVMTAPLSDILRFPDYKYGGRILNVTVGKGTHNTMMHGGGEFDINYDVNENEVYITYDTTDILSGGIFTAVMQRGNGENKITERFTHSRS